MPSYPYHTPRASGIMDPEQLAQLQQVFAEACHRNRIAPATEAAKITAKRLLTAFRSGVSDRKLLMWLVTNPTYHFGAPTKRLRGTLTEIELDLVGVGHEIARRTGSKTPAASLIAANAQWKKLRL
jgi:hypothetical protein